MLSIHNLSRAADLGNNIVLADSFRTRLVGLLSTKHLTEGDGLLLTNTRAVHTWGMRFTIDCLFLDNEQRVVQIVPSLKPWRFSPIVKGACQVLELPVGTITRTHTHPGDMLQINDASYSPALMEN